jgi:hypothetical protein
MSIKKVILSIALVWLSGQFIFSQTSLGLNVGTNYSNWVSYQSHVAGRPGYNAGVFFTKSLGSRLLIRADAEYIQFGGRVLQFDDLTLYGVDPDETPFPVKTRDGRINLQTVNIPLNFSFLLVNTDALMLSIGAGPEVSMLLQATSRESVTAKTENVYVTWDQDNNEARNYEEFNYAASGIVQIAVPVQGFMLNTSFRYRWSFNPVRNSFSYLNQNENVGEIYQGTFIISVGLGLNFRSNNSE